MDADKIADIIWTMILELPQEAQEVVEEVIGRLSQNVTS